MSRSMENLLPQQALIERRGGEAICIECDVSEEASIVSAFAECRERLPGDIDCMVYNAGIAPRGPGRRVPGSTRPIVRPPAAWMASQQESCSASAACTQGLSEDIDVSQFDMAYKVHVSGLLCCAQQVLPSMREKQSGTILITGNTQSVRGTAAFGTTSPSKFAQRGLSQCMAQEYKPEGVHVCLMIVDGTTDAVGIRRGYPRGIEKSLAREEAEPGQHMLSPAAIGEAALYLTTQPSSVWTHELWMTPAKVRLGQRL